MNLGVKYGNKAGVHMEKKELKKETSHDNIEDILKKVPFWKVAVFGQRCKSVSDGLYKI